METIRRQEKFFNIAKNIIENNNGICLSTVGDYITAHSDLQVKCNDGHIFKITYNNLKHAKWCAQCKINLGELISKCVLEDLFNKKFSKIRPDWLKNKNGNRVEIDMFNDELQLGLEYNGIQHYKFLKHFHKTQSAFEKLQYHDDLKIKICNENNIKLIIVPYTVQHEKIYDFIYDKCIKYGFDVSKSENFSILSCLSKSGKLAKVKDIIKEKNGEFIKSIKDDIICIKCDKGHFWETKLIKICAGSWCHTCGKIVKDDTKEKISKQLKQFNSTNEGKNIKNKSLKKRSETMSKIKKTLREDLLKKGEKCCKGKCNQILPLCNFNIKNDTQDGYQPWCKNCVRIAKQEWIQKKRDEEK